MNPERVLFVGMGGTPLCYYRCMLPAVHMGADWCGVVGEPPSTEEEWKEQRVGLHFVTGQIRGRSQVPDLTSDDYDIIVLQQPKGGAWARLIDILRDRGKIVLYEIDDYLHGIAVEKNHPAREFYTKTKLNEIEWAMKHCDGLIVSTDFIAEQYRNFNKRVFVCRNGIDLKRYDLKRPRRDVVNIGWSGAQNHIEALLPWLMQVDAIMKMRERVCFVSVGDDSFGNGLAQVHGKERAIGVPWAQVEQYPGAMTMFDMALAPSAGTPWWKGKSDLRWLEASALGCPVIADPKNYPEIVHGETGLHAHSPQEAAELMLRLVDDPVERRIIGRKAKEYIREKRGMGTMVEQWREVFETVIAER